LISARFRRGGYFFPSDLGGWIFFPEQFKGVIFFSERFRRGDHFFRAI